MDGRRGLAPSTSDTHSKTGGTEQLDHPLIVGSLFTPGDGDFAQINRRWLQSERTPTAGAADRQ